MGNKPGREGGGAHGADGGALASSPHPPEGRDASPLEDEAGSHASGPATGPRGSEATGSARGGESVGAGESPRSALSGGEEGTGQATSASPGLDHADQAEMRAESPRGGSTGGSASERDDIGRDAAESPRSAGSGHRERDHLSTGNESEGGGGSGSAPGDSAFDHGAAPQPSPVKRASFASNSASATSCGSYVSVYEPRLDSSGGLSGFGRGLSSRRSPGRGARGHGDGGAGTSPRSATGAGQGRFTVDGHTFFPTMRELALHYKDAAMSDAKRQEVEKRQRELKRMEEESDRRNAEAAERMHRKRTVPLAQGPALPYSEMKCAYDLKPVAQAIVALRTSRLALRSTPGAPGTRKEARDRFNAALKEVGTHIDALCDGYLLPSAHAMQYWRNVAARAETGRSARALFELHTRWRRAAFVRGEYERVVARNRPTVHCEVLGQHMMTEDAHMRLKWEVHHLHTLDRQRAAAAAAQRVHPEDAMFVVTEGDKAEIERELGEERAAVERWRGGERPTAWKPEPAPAASKAVEGGGEGQAGAPAAEGGASEEKEEEEKEKEEEEEEEGPKSPKSPQRRASGASSTVSPHRRRRSSVLQHGAAEEEAESRAREEERMQELRDRVGAAASHAAQRLGEDAEEEAELLAPAVGVFGAQVASAVARDAGIAAGTGGERRSHAAAPEGTASHAEEVTGLSEMAGSLSTHGSQRRASPKRGGGGGGGTAKQPVADPIRNDDALAEATGDASALSRFRTEDGRVDLAAILRLGPDALRRIGAQWQGMHAPASPFALHLPHAEQAGQLLQGGGEGTEEGEGKEKTPALAEGPTTAGGASESRLPPAAASAAAEAPAAAAASVESAVAGTGVGAGVVEELAEASGLTALQVVAFSAPALQLSAQSLREDVEQSMMTQDVRRMMGDSDSEGEEGGGQSSAAAPWPRGSSAGSTQKGVGPAAAATATAQPSSDQAGGAAGDGGGESGVKEVGTDQAARWRERYGIRVADVGGADARLKGTAAGGGESDGRRRGGSGVATGEVAPASATTAEMDRAALAVLRATRLSTLHPNEGESEEERKLAERVRREVAQRLGGAEDDVEDRAKPWFTDPDAAARAERQRQTEEAAARAAAQLDAMRSERKRSELGLRAGAGAGAEGEGEGGQSMLEEGHRWQKSDFVGRYHLSRIAAKYPIPGKALAVDKVKAARVKAADEAEDKVRALREGHRGVRAEVARIAKERMFEFQRAYGAGLMRERGVELRMLEVQAERAEAAMRQDAATGAVTAEDNPEGAALLPLVQRSREGDVRRRLLALPPPRARDAVATVEHERGEAPLHWAVGRADLPMCRTLVEFGADPNQRSYEHCVPLHFAWRHWLRVRRRNPVLAAARGKSVQEVVELLMDAGADPNVREPRRGRVALHFAADYGHVSTAIALLKGGAKWDVKDEAGTSPLDLATRNGHRNLAFTFRSWPQIVRAGALHTFRYGWEMFLRDPNATLETYPGAADVKADALREDRMRRVARVRRGGGLAVCRDAGEDVPSDDEVEPGRDELPPVEVLEAIAAAELGEEGEEGEGGEEHSGAATSSHVARLDTVAQGGGGGGSVGNASSGGSDGGGLEEEDTAFVNIHSRGRWGSLNATEAQHRRAATFFGALGRGGDSVRRARLRAMRTERKDDEELARELEEKERERLDERLRLRGRLRRAAEHAKQGAYVTAPHPAHAAARSSGAGAAGEGARDVAGGTGHRETAKLRRRAPAPTGRLQGIETSKLVEAERQGRDARQIYLPSPALGRPWRWRRAAEADSLKERGQLSVPQEKVGALHGAADAAAAKGGHVEPLVDQRQLPPPLPANDLHSGPLGRRGGGDGPARVRDEAMHPHLRAPHPSLVAARKAVPTGMGAGMGVGAELADLLFSPASTYWSPGEAEARYAAVPSERSPAAADTEPGRGAGTDAPLISLLRRRRQGRSESALPPPTAETGGGASPLARAGHRLAQPSPALLASQIRSHSKAAAERERLLTNARDVDRAPSLAQGRRRQVMPPPYTKHRFAPARGGKAASAALAEESRLEARRKEQESKERHARLYGGSAEEAEKEGGGEAAAQGGKPSRKVYAEDADGRFRELDTATQSQRAAREQRVREAAREAREHLQYQEQLRSRRPWLVPQKLPSPWEAVDRRTQVRERGPGGGPF